MLFKKIRQRESHHAYHARQQLLSKVQKLEACRNTIFEQRSLTLDNRQLSFNADNFCDTTDVYDISHPARIFGYFP